MFRFLRSEVIVIYSGRDFNPGERFSAISVEYIAFVWLCHPLYQNRALSFLRSLKLIDLGFKQLQKTMTNDSVNSTIDRFSVT